MKNSNKKQIALQLSFFAGIIGVTAIFIRFGMTSLLIPVAVVAVIVLLFDFIMSGIGSAVSSKMKIPKWVNRAYSVLMVVLISFISLCVLVYAVQDSMFFYYVNDSESRDFLQGRQGYSEVEFTAENGKTYHGMMYLATEEKAPLVIYFGGNGEVSYQRLKGLEENNRWSYYAGYHYLFVDYEGYGLNEGKTGQKSMYEGALAVYDYAVTLDNVESDRIVTMGYSMGTGSAVYLAANRHVAGIILAAPYANGNDLYNNMLPIFYGPMQLLVKQKIPSEEYAPDVSCPALVIASRSDEAVPFASSERLSELFSGDVDFMELDNAWHNEIFQADGVYDRVQNFLEEVAVI